MRSIAFIGGDKRNYILSEMMGEYGKVLKFGLDDNNDLFNECINADYIVFPIPFSLSFFISSWDIFSFALSSFSIFILKILIIN